MIAGKIDALGRERAVAVDLAAIERDLAQLWREASSDGEAVTRACLWNLVVRTRGDAEHARAEELVDAIVGSTPARVLMLIEDDAATATSGDEIEAWISAHCHVAPGGGKLLCSEKVTVRSRGAGRRHVPALVRALRVPDVPTAMLWFGAPPGRQDDPCAICERIDRLIVDTGRAARAAVDGSGPAVDLAGIFWTASSGLEVADLGWLRLRPFRQLFSSFFDPPVGASPLARATKVRVDAAYHGGATSLLLLGWLANQLGWSAAEPVRETNGASRAWTVRTPQGRHVHLEMLLRDVDAGVDGIHELALETDAGERFAITDVGPSQIELRGTGLPVRVVGAPERDDSELLIAALGVRGHDSAFLPALERAASLWR